MNLLDLRGAWSRFFEPRPYRLDKHTAIRVRKYLEGCIEDIRAADGAKNAILNKRVD